MFLCLATLSIIHDAKEDKFHAFGPQRVYAGTTDEWYKNYHGACRNGVGCGKEDIGQRLANESQCCSRDTISFRAFTYLLACCCRPVLCS